MNTEELLSRALTEILRQSSTLAALMPQAALTDDDQKKPDTSLTIALDFTGRSIEILDDYTATITLSREFRGADSQADFTALCREVRAAVDAWYVRFLDTQIFRDGLISHLTIDSIEQSGSPEIQGDEISYALTFAAFIAGN